MNTKSRMEKSLKPQEWIRECDMIHRYPSDKEFFQMVDGVFSSSIRGRK